MFIEYNFQVNKLKIENLKTPPTHEISSNQIFKKEPLSPKDFYKPKPPKKSSKTPAKKSTNTKKPIVKRPPSPPKKIVKKEAPNFHTKDHKKELPRPVQQKVVAERDYRVKSQPKFIIKQAGRNK